MKVDDLSKNEIVAVTKFNQPLFRNMSHQISDGFPLGRIWVPDVRDYQYPAHLALGYMKPKVLGQTQSRYWEPGELTNQGNTNHCVGFTSENLLLAAPIKTYGAEDGHTIYYKCEELDEFNTTEQGTSLRAGAKALIALGYAKQFVHARDVNTIHNWLLTQGPVMIGTNWYEAMNEPNPTDGYLLHPRGRVVGGHAYLLIGTDGEARKFKMKQTWGDWWGNRGFAYLGWDDAARLLVENGDAIMMIEEKVIVGATQ